MGMRERKEYKFITLEERREIERMHREGFSPYEIAETLHRSAPTIYAELRRGRVGKHGYSAKLAQKQFYDNMNRRGYFRSTSGDEGAEGQTYIFKDKQGSDGNV